MARRSPSSSTSRVGVTPPEPLTGVLLSSCECEVDAEADGCLRLASMTDGEPGLLGVGARWAWVVV